MRQAIDTDQKPDQRPLHLPVVPQFGNPAWLQADMIQNLFKPEQIQPPDPPSKFSKRAKPFRNGFPFCIHPSVQHRGNNKL